MAAVTEIIGFDIGATRGDQYLIRAGSFKMDILVDVARVCIRVAFDLRDRLLFQRRFYGN